MSGRKKSAVLITQEELSSHNKPDSAWLALDGKVYDVTKYIAKHPGGVSPISKGLGKDATSMFNAVHPYVKYEKILSGHQVGILDSGSAGNSHESDASKQMQTEKKKLKKGWRCFSCCSDKQGKDELPDTKLFESEGSLTYVVMFPSKKPSTKLDWTIGILNKSTLIIKKVINKSDVVVIQMKLLNRLVDDTLLIQFEADWSVLELTLTKPVAGQRWNKIGDPQGDNNTVMDSRAASDRYEANIVYKEKLTTDVYLFGLRLKPSAYFGIPIGFHTVIYLGDTGKPYTPVCYSILGDREPNLGAIQGQVIWYIIKIYETGSLTSKLDELPVVIPIPDSPIQEFQLLLGTPGGNFDMEFLSNPTTEVVFLLAGGTGITPMIRIIEWHLEKAKKGENSRRVILIYWNRTQDDIIWRDVWEELVKEESKWFHFFPVCTGSLGNWTGLTGRPSSKQIQGIIDKLPKDISQSKARQGYICGSPGFNTAVEKTVSGIIPADHLHIFAG